MQVVSMFVKYPEAGKVKTRLAKTVGFEEAARIYDELARLNFKVLRSLLNKESAVVVFFDPPDKKQAIQNWLPGASDYIVQRGEGLGERLKGAFEDLFDQGFRKVLVVGSDTLKLEAKMIEKSWKELDTHDVVLGPAKDGGYYLVGMNAYYGEIFDDVSWSTETVLEETLKKIVSLSLKYSLVDELEDLDEVKQEETI